MIVSIYKGTGSRLDQSGTHPLKSAQEKQILITLLYLSVQSRVQIDAGQTALLVAKLRQVALEACKNECESARSLKAMSLEHVM